MVVGARGGSCNGGIQGGVVFGGGGGSSILVSSGPVVSSGCFSSGVCIIIGR
jgi:hypothetical protein